MTVSALCFIKSYSTGLAAVQTQYKQSIKKCKCMCTVFYSAVPAAALLQQSWSLLIAFCVWSIKSTCFNCWLKCVYWMYWTRTHLYFFSTFFCFIADSTNRQCIKWQTIEWQWIWKSKHSWVYSNVLMMLWCVCAHNL